MPNEPEMLRDMGDTYRSGRGGAEAPEPDKPSRPDGAIPIAKKRREPKPMEGCFFGFREDGSFFFTGM